MNALVLSTDYSSPDGRISLQYVHMRNLYYQQQGIRVTVINFHAKESYELEGIKVIPLSVYEKSSETYS